MKIKKWLFAIAVATFTLLVYPFQSVNANPQETTWVYDETGDLTTETLDYITHLNEEVFPNYIDEPQFGLEILYTLPEGYSDIDTYKNERFNELGIGAEGKDSGLFYVMSIGDRRFGIETGYGIEHVITDIEAKGILDDAQAYMQEYSETGSPEYLNEAVMRAFQFSDVMFSKADSGLLAEEREEAERQKELEREQSRKTFRNVLLGLGGVTLTGVVGFAGVELHKKKEEERRLKKLEEQVENAGKEFEKFYKDGNVPFENELSYATFMGYYNEKMEETTTEKVEHSLQDKLATVNQARVTLLDSIIKKQDKKYSVDYYLNNTSWLAVKLLEKPELSTQEAMNLLDKEFEHQEELLATETQKLVNEVEGYFNKYDVPEGLDKDELINKVNEIVKNEYKLGVIGVRTRNIGITEPSEYQNRIDYWYRTLVIRSIMDKNSLFSGGRFDYGNRDGFTKFAQDKVVKSDTPTSDLLKTGVLIGMLVALRTTYIKREEKAYKDEQLRIKKQREKEKKDEEDRRRRARQRSMSSSSSSSSRSSSGGSFGGGFGGGRSGGGGASGGW